MTLPMAAWRVTYTPGNWLVLSGPTMLVVMLPAPARMSGLVNSLWADVVNARSVDGLLELLNSYGLDSMPDFGAFFWDSDGLHGIARGRIKVIDTDTGEVAVDGEQTITWREENLGADRHLRIDMEPVDQDAVLQLPLVVGAASASAIYLTTHADEQIRFPSYEQLGVLPRTPVLGLRPRARRSAPEVEAPAAGEAVSPDVAAPAPVAPVAAVDAVAAAPVAAAEVGTAVADSEAGAPAPTDAPAPVSADDDALVPDEPRVAVSPEVEQEGAASEEAVTEEAAPGPEAIAEPEPSAPEVPAVSAPEVPAASAPEAPTPEPPVAPQPSAPADPSGPQSADSYAIGTGELAFDTQVMASPETEPQPEPQRSASGLPSAPAPAGVGSAQPPTAPPPTGNASAPVVVPGGFAQQDQAEEDGGTIFSTGLAATHKPAAQTDADPDPQVLAVPCANGHANAPGTRHCRLCKAPVDSSNARLIRRPVLAGVHSNQGEFADIFTGVVVGRSPDASKGPGGAYLMRVPSPSSDISRSHVLVTTRDWSIVVTDLHSTNGTTVMPVGEQPFVLANGETVQVELGTVLDLGDGVSLRIEPPRG